MKEMVSIEEVLNSRCSSDFDFDPGKSHFGTFVNERPPETAINHIIHCLGTPRFSSGKLLNWFKDEYLFLGFENSKDAYAQRVLHIESGMQHEAIYLACAAEGVGTCIDNQGINGTQNGEKTTTAKYLIMKMADPYETGRFTTKAPGPRKQFVPGKNLTEPFRKGNFECLPKLSRLATFNKSGASATEKDASQLLWAAKGRTPHCIKINKWNLMWGLTIPTWGGGQDYTSVYLLKDRKLYLYGNWTKKFSLMNRLFREKFR
jgi:hypothetical protein